MHRPILIVLAKWGAKLFATIFKKKTCVVQNRNPFSNVEISTNNTSKFKKVYTRRRTMGEKGENPMIRRSEHMKHSKFFCIFVTPYIKWDSYHMSHTVLKTQI